MPMLYNTRYSSRRRVTVMISVVWVLSFAISCPLLFGLNNTGRRATHVQYKVLEIKMIFNGMWLNWHIERNDCAALLFTQHSRQQLSIFTSCITPKQCDGVEYASDREYRWARRRCSALPSLEEDCPQFPVCRAKTADRSPKLSGDSKVL